MFGVVVVGSVRDLGYKRIDDSVKQAYLEWLLTPPGERDITTKEDMAAHLGVAVRTLYNWEATDEFKNELRKLKSKWGLRWHGDILGKLMDIVLTGPPAQSVNAAKVLLSHLDLGDGEEKQEELTDEALKRIKSALEEAGYATTD